MPRAARLIPPLTLLPLPALAQQVIVGGAAGLPTPESAWAIGGGIALALVLIGALVVALHRSIRRTAEWCGETLAGASPADVQEARLRAFALLHGMPLGVPEGTIRACIGLFIIVLGVCAIVFQRQLGLGTTGELAGLLGTVLGFYFGTRSTSGDREAAREATRVAAEKTAEAASARQRADAVLAREGEIRAEAAQAAETEAKARSTLGEVVRIAGNARSIAEAVASIAPDLPLARTAARVTTLADSAIAVVRSATAGTVDAGAVREAAGRAAALVAEIGGEDPLAKLVSGATGGLAGALKGVAGLAGAVGGPLGLAGAVLVGAAGAFRIGTEHYRRWVARVLDRPYGLDLYPEGLSDAPMALSAIEVAPIFRRAYGGTILAPRDLAAARALLAAALSPEAERLIPAGDGALRPAPVGEGGVFATTIELEQGIQQFRRAVLERILDQTDTAPVAVTLPSGPVSVPQGTLRQAIDAAREDPGGAAALDQLALAGARLAREPGVDITASLARAAAEAA
jgi:hypothetical protein